MTLQRVGRIPKTKEELKRKAKGLCIICEKTLPKRRKTFCSTECEYVWWGKHDWSWLRREILKRDNYKCVKCGFQVKIESFYFVVVNDPLNLSLNDQEDIRTNYLEGTKVKGYYYSPLVVDHINPIAMGGGEFDRENLQVLCKWCNKVKTKSDMGKIAELRQGEKTIVANETFKKQHHSILEFV